MSGSGATVLAVLKDKESAVALGNRVIQEFGENLWLCVRNRGVRE
jgi:4-diphosphocytidyl-2C-methyl-D-erythritol kinase